MSGIVRRRLIQTAAAATALSGAAPGLARAASVGAPSKLSDIDHFIILMKENRSFDHYFGSLCGVRGFDDPTARRPDGGSIFRQPDPGHADGFVMPFRMNTHQTSAQRVENLSHAFTTQHASWNGGAMDNWAPAHRISDGDRGPMTMGFLAREDIPYYYALADAFTLCDGYFCSVFGPTHPNRYFLMTATNDPDGVAGGPAINNSGKAYSWETYPERLEKAGISWRVYHDFDDYECNILKFFTQYQHLSPTSALYQNALVDRPFYQLLADLRSGDIPQVTWIVPPSDVSEHPDYLPAAGEDHTSQVLAALWSNPKLWAKTAVIINYDENDGLFDHVAPPTPPPGTPGEFVQGLPVGLGFRVPCFVVSPFSRGGYVCGDTFDHTSTLRLLETRFGVEVPNLSAWRRRTTGDLTTAFGFGSPPRYDIPRMPETEQALRLAQLRVVTLPPPTVPAEQRLPRQEPGSRPRRGGVQSA
ncbi:MAG TPA: alkaline phosphatase family protein [Caulobacteraceae bacterium]|jgi:phospholipase C|nr:alkaline phosphatase family protein [Caulobacteraceae bacterium]